MGRFRPISVLLDRNTRFRLLFGLRIYKTMEPSIVEKEALSLDLASRARLASKLIESLDELSKEETRQLWAEEALRRDTEWDAGDVVGIPVEDAILDARSRIS